ncbi:MAG: hypothetical protein ABR860_09095 [Terracidiphilus sp.]|jgi:membrane-anchored glycerophosphoryl diester phosphodiesterase (GDPDase)
MDNRLRPMNLGEILDGTAALYRTYFLLFTGISSIFATAMLAIDLLYLRSLVLLGYPNLSAHWQWSTAAAAVAEALVILLLAGLSIVAINRAVAWVYLDQPATIRAAAKSVLPKARRYLWLMTVVAFRAWAPLAALYVAFFAIVLSAMPHGFLTNPAAVPQAPQDPSGIIAAGLGMLVLAPLMLLATVYGVWMSLRYSLAVPSCVVEDLTAKQAIQRSIKLSEGSRGRIFVLGLLVYAVRLMLGLLFGFPIIVLAVKHLGQPLPIGWMVFQQLGVFFSNALIGPIYAIGLTLFYYDQRIRKEGYDIEWMIQAAGLLPQHTNSGPAASPLP